MELVTFVLFLTCAKAQIINESVDPWNNQDTATFNRAVKVCMTDKHYTDTPCLKTFYKRDVGTYAAICAAEKKRS